MKDAVPPYVPPFWPADDEKFPVISPQGAAVAMRAIIEQGDPELLTPDGCRGMWGLVSNTFLRFLNELGIDAINVQLWKDDEPHIVTLCQGWALDFTARQYDPKAEVPAVAPVAALIEQGWQIIGHLKANELKEPDQVAKEIEKAARSCRWIGEP